MLSHLQGIHVRVVDHRVREISGKRVGDICGIEFARHICAVSESSSRDTHVLSHLQGIHVRVVDHRVCEISGKESVIFRGSSSRDTYVLSHLQGIHVRRE